VRPKQVQVKLAIPFLGEISGTWESDEPERRAAWELYVSWSPLSRWCSWAHRH
jgi:hypothetical protein